MLEYIYLIIYMRNNKIINMQYIFLVYVDELYL